MQVVLASRNKKKIAELRTLLSEQIGSEIEVLSLDDIGYYDDIVETGETFEENAITKASVPASLGYIGIADDSGLCVNALNGAPGVYSARYSGGDDEDNNDLLLRELEKSNEGLRHRIFHAMCKSEIDGFALHGRYPDAGQIADEE